LKFDQAFPGAKIVKLEQNYRSTKTVLAAANTVIGNNKDRHGKTLWSDHAEGEKITHAVAATAEDEAKWVAQEIRRIVKEGRRWSDVAILYRSNIQSKILEEELRTIEVPYVMYGGQQFFERKEVKDLIAYLRLALNKRDELALRRVINYPGRGIGATTIEKLSLAAQATHTTMWAALGKATEHGVHTSAAFAIAGFVEVVERLGTSLESGTDVVAATKQLIEDIKLNDDLRHAAASMAAAQRRIDNVTGLLGSLERWSAKGKGVEKLAEFLRHLSLDTSDDEKHEPGDKVVLTTLHGAKGLEFPVCFMIGLEEELLPHIRTLQPQATDVLDADHATDISEERRLCYVGITRAQRKLYLTRACTRISRGRVLQRTPSRFLLEIPDELLEIRDIAEEARQQVPKDEVRSFFANFDFGD
jgi:DNA helicase-2/ATP-dependent DNA helicase PcrA